MSLRRCQRCDIRSFHGLCFPSKASRVPLQGRAMPSSTSLAVPKRCVAPAALRSMASQVRCATAGIPPAILPRRPRRSGADGPVPGAEAESERHTFSVGRPEPGTVRRALTRRGGFENDAVSLESVRNRGWGEADPRCPSSPPDARGRPLREGEPRGATLRPSWGFSDVKERSEERSPRSAPVYLFLLVSVS